MDFGVSPSGASSAQPGPHVAAEHCIYLPLVLKSAVTGEPAPSLEPRLPPGADWDSGPPSEELLPRSAPPSEVDADIQPPIEQDRAN